jgi:hypothetical protein
MFVSTETRCPHCNERLVKWRNPEMSSWSGEYQYVCFNDKCPYFVRGWRWMLEQYEVTASYRFRLDPATGDSGPLPVWSKDALRDLIVADEVMTDNKGGTTHA